MVETPPPPFLSLKLQTKYLKWPFPPNTYNVEVFNNASVVI